MLSMNEKYSHIKKTDLEFYIQKGLSISEIAGALDLERGTVSHLLKKFELKTKRAVYGMNAHYFDIPVESLKESVKIGLTIKELSEKFKTSEALMFRILKANNLKTKFSTNNGKQNYEELEESTCGFCKKTKSISEFTSWVNSSGNRKPQSYCITCSKLKRNEFKKLAVELKGGKCVICNYDKCLGALEFHHIDSKTKESEISTLTSKKASLDVLVKELEKCVLLCNRCHREVHLGVTKLPENSEP